MAQEVNVAILYVPCGSEEEAAGIATQLLVEGLIACGNIVQSRSLHLWEGSLADEKEHILLCKTTNQAKEAAQQRIEELHSYDVPCIISVGPASVNGAYSEWVISMVSAGAGTTVEMANSARNEAER